METRPTGRLELSPAEKKTDSRLVIIACILPLALGALYFALAALDWLDEGILAGEFGTGMAVVSAFVAVCSVLVGICGGLSLAWSRKKFAWLLAPLAAVVGFGLCVFVGIGIAFSGMGC